MPTPRLRAVLASLAFAIAAAGCSRADIDRAAGTLASAAPALASDGFIVAQIETKLVAIDGDSALHVAVASHGGNVKLSGRTRTAAIAARYVAAAHSIAGVRGVAASLVADASLRSTAASVSDFALAATVRANLVGQAGLNAADLEIKAERGVVTLRGRVRTPELRSTLVESARATRGVRSVVDDLHVSANAS